MQFTEIYLKWRTGSSRLCMPDWDARKRSRISGLGAQSSFYIEPTGLRHSELTVLLTLIIDYIIVTEFFQMASPRGAPLSRGAPCHGIIGILVNPALVLVVFKKPNRNRGIWPKTEPKQPGEPSQHLLSYFIECCVLPEVKRIL